MPTTSFQDLIPEDSVIPTKGGRTIAPPPDKQPGGTATTQDSTALPFNTQAPATTVPNPTTAAPAPAAGTDLFTPENVGSMTDTLNQFGDQAPAIQPEETVQGQLDKILDKDNALFDWARGQASQYANSRGLQNSDIAAQAGTQSVLNVALPIAQQDASTYAQRALQKAGYFQAGGLQAMQGTIQSSLMAQDHLQSLVQQSHQGDINSRLQLEQYGYNWNLSEQQNLFQMQQLALQGDINSRLALEAFGFDVQLMEQDFGYRVTLTQMELENALALSAQDHTQWLDRISATHVNTLSEIVAQGAQNQELQAQLLEGQLNNALAQIQATGDQELILQANQFAHDAELQRQAIQGQLDSALAQIEASGDIDSRLQAERAEQQAQLDLDRINAQLAADLDTIAAQGDVSIATNTEQFTQQVQASYLSAVERRTLQFSAEVTSIYQQQGLTAAQQENAVRVARANMENDIAMLQDYYRASPYWDPNYNFGIAGGPTNPYGYDFTDDDTSNDRGTGGGYVPPTDYGGSGGSYIPPAYDDYNQDDIYYG
jgi:hypothetical protein